MYREAGLAFFFASLWSPRLAATGTRMDWDFMD